MSDPALRTSEDNSVSQSAGSLIVADWERDGGSGFWRVVLPSGDEIQVSREEMLRHGVTGPTLVIEAAHMQPRNELSIAQVYSLEELREWYALLQEAEATVLLFPEKLSARARLFAGLEKHQDPQAIAYYLTQTPGAFAALQRWRLREDFDDAMSMRLDMTIRLNMARGDSTYSAWGERDRVLALLAQITPGLSEECAEYFGLKIKRDGALRKTIKWAQIASLYVALFDVEGQLRALGPGWLKFVWNRLLLQHPYRARHRGTARSNLMHWGLEPFLAARGVPRWSDDPLGHMEIRKPHIAEWRRIQKEMLRSLRNGALAGSGRMPVGDLAPTFPPPLEGSGHVPVATFGGAL